MSKKKIKTGKLPKTIAGIKLPKEARRQVKKAIAELRQPIVREVIAGAVGIAAAAVAKQAAAARTAPLSEPIPNSATKAEDKPTGSSGGEQWAEMATGLAVVGLGKLFEKMQALADAKAPEPKR